MGCDIHFIVEKKVGNKWIGLMATDITEINSEPVGCQRNYKFFAELANVRGTGSSDCDPKGIPDDASELAMMLFDKQEDAHSHSFCSAKEFCRKFGETTEDPCYREEILGVRVNDDDYDDDYSALIDDLRVIFYFDN